MTVKVLIADDHDIVREGIKMILEEDSGIEVVGQVNDGRLALEVIPELKPDVVVMDITMPDLNGIEATRRIERDFPKVKIIGLSMHSSRRVIKEMLEAGADGYLIKNSTMKELRDAIYAVNNGKKFLSSQITGDVIFEYLKPSDVEEDKPYIWMLTGREREVLQLLCEGFSNRHIATKLDVSDRTIEAHRANIMRKLKIHNLAGLTKFAIREGLTSLEPK
ncbi:response regulator transcription factor [bacterium]|nr:response regulator transcription factor [bacterium]